MNIRFSLEKRLQLSNPVEYSIIYQTNEHPQAESLQGIRQLNKSLRICDIRLMTSEIALRQLYSPYGELRIYLI